MLKPGAEFRRTEWLLALILLLTLPACVPGWGQSSSPPPAQNSTGNGQSQGDQTIPDAPSAVQPAKPPQENPPSENAPPPMPQPTVPSSQPPPQSNEPAVRAPTDAERGINPGQPPPVNLVTVPEGGATREDAPDENGIYHIPPVHVNQIMVPVTVKDESGHLVNGLTFKDFSVLENGKKQKLNFFSSSPFALSAAVVIDVGMKDVDLQKVKHTLASLQGAFSQFDELSIYAYTNTVGQLADWQAVGQRLSDAFDQLAEVSGENNGPPVTSGPFSNGPYINGRPADPAAPTVHVPVQKAQVLNDAILRAALDLAQRPRERRKVIFVISDGREYRSNASYRDVLRVLLSNNIIVYAINAGGNALPVFNQLSRVHLPRAGYSDILPKYVNATGGGEVFNVLTRTAIEDAYTAAMNQARNQYTLGYIMPSTPPGGYRDIEVLVDRPNCRSAIRPCVNVWAKSGYYPVPRAK